jgi:hypothetical protein
VSALTRTLLKTASTANLPTKPRQRKAKRLNQSTEKMYADGSAVVCVTTSQVGTRCI